MRSRHIRNSCLWELGYQHGPYVNSFDPEEEKRRKRQKGVIEDYIEEVDEDLEVRLEVHVFDVEEIIEKGIYTQQRFSKKRPYYVYAGLNKEDMTEMKHQDSCESITISLDPRLNNYRFLYLEIVQYHYPVAGEFIGPSEGKVVVGRTEIELPVGYDRIFHINPRFVRMVEGDFKVEERVEVKFRKTRRHKQNNTPDFAAIHKQLLGQTRYPGLPRFPNW